MNTPFLESRVIPIYSRWRSNEAIVVSNSGYTFYQAKKQFSPQHNLFLTGEALHTKDYYNISLLFASLAKNKISTSLGKKK